jgi:hypothetical protein
MFGVWHRIGDKMIKTLEDVRIYWEKDADGNPDENRIPAPGLSSDDVTLTRAALPGLPDNYLDVISRLDFEAAGIQFTSLSPSSYGSRRGEMVKALVYLNSNEIWAFDLLSKHKLYWIGSSGSGDPICVAAQDTPVPGEVIWLNHETQEFYRIANNFEQFVVGLTRLDDQDRVSGPRGEEGVEFFVTSIRDDFALDDEQMDFWITFAEMTLDDWDE